MADQKTKTAPIRLERDGNVAVMVLENPPLNLFGDDAWSALVSCVDEVEGSHAPPPGGRAAGGIITGGGALPKMTRGRPAMPSAP